uniref:Protein kinase domain-containing protein n=1 Tax=Timema shepardi TaxID=629360 RepID=A0A7R9G2A5_TIMSH|nr:unnamed protein product [Timema shepardi]
MVPVADDPHANFPRHQMKYLRELGRGWFGRVVEGEAQGLVPGEQTSKVVVKILHEDATPTDQMYFLHEMKPYRDLQHPNLLRLLGHCLETDPFLVLLESCPGGDLKSFLSTNAATSDALNQQGVTLQMACNISAGLQHMLDRGFVHTDLATRNCMVTPDLTVKIGDYGNGIETYKVRPAPAQALLVLGPYDEYYCAGDVALPIRWCAPETLHCTDTTIETKEVTSCANVWTLGVVLWELCEFGKLPYAELTDDEVIVRVLGSGTYRLGLPTLPSPHRHNLYLVMKQCWSPSLQRPALSQVHCMLHHMYSSRERHMKEGDTCSLNSDEDFERRWEAFKPNTIPKTDHMVAVEEVPLPPPRHVEETQQSDLFSDRTSVDSGILSRERGNADAYSSTSPQPSLSSSTGGEFFTPTIRHHHKSLQTPDGSLREEVADVNLLKIDNADLEEETKVNETREFDSWLQGVETTNDEDTKFVQKISEAIRDLDDALALEKTSSSSESSSNSASHHDSPAKDVTSSDQNVVLDFRLGRLYSDATEKFIEETFPPDSYQDDSFLELNWQSGKARLENRGTDSGTDTEDETWQIRIEQGEFTEKVKQKSKSVADLMILTHIDSSEGSDSDTPSLTWSLERGSNNRGSLTKQRAVLSNKVSLNVAAGLLFGSESNIHGAVLGQEFKDTLEKLHAAQKDAGGTSRQGEVRGPFLDQRTSLSEEDTLSSPTASSVVPVRGKSQIDGSTVSSNHNGKENFLSNDASEKEHREEKVIASIPASGSLKESVSDNASILASGLLKESASDNASILTSGSLKESASDNASILASGSLKESASDNASILASGSLKESASDNASILASGSLKESASDNASILASGSLKESASDNASILASGSLKESASDNASILASGSLKESASDNASILASGSLKESASDNASILASGSLKESASDNASILASGSLKESASDNASILASGSLKESASDNASILASGSLKESASDNASILASGSLKESASDNASILASGSLKESASDNASILASGSLKESASDNASILASGSLKESASDNASILASGSLKESASDNASILASGSLKESASDNASILASGSLKESASDNASILASGSLKESASDNASILASGSLKESASDNASILASGSLKESASDNASILASGSLKESASDSASILASGSLKESASDNASILASGSLKESAIDSALFIEPAAKQSDNLITVQKCSEVPHVGGLSSDVNIPSNNLDKFSSSVIPLSDNINCFHLDPNKLSVSAPTNLSSDAQKKLEENEMKLILPETSLERMIPKSVASTIETIEHLRRDTVEPEEISLTNEEQPRNKESENTFPAGYTLESEPLVGSSADRFDTGTLHPSRTKRCVENERLEASPISELTSVGLEGDVNKITLSCMESSSSDKFANVAALSRELRSDSLETDSVIRQGPISNADKTRLDESIVPSNVFAVSDVQSTDNITRAGVQDDSSDGHTKERASVILGPCEDYTLDYFKGLKTTFIEGEKTREHCEDSHSGEYFVNGNASEDKEDFSIDTWDRYLGDACRDMSSDISFSLEQGNSTTSDHISENKSQGSPNILRRRVDTGPTVAKGRNIDWDGRIEDFVKIVPESNVPKSFLNEADSRTVEDINEVEDCREPSSSKDSVCFIHEVEGNMKASPLEEIQCLAYTKESKTDLEQPPLNENLCSIDTKESKTDLEQPLLNKNRCSIDTEESKTDLEQSPLNERWCSIDTKECKTDLEQSPLDENLCYIDSKESINELEQSPSNENRCFIDTKESKTELEHSFLNENLCSIDIKESKTNLEQSPLNENLCSIDTKESKTDLEQSLLNENLCSIDTKESKTDLEQSLLNENLCYIDTKESKSDLEQSLLNKNLCYIDIKESKTDLEQTLLNENLCSIGTKESKTDLEQSLLNENLCSIDTKESKTDLEQPLLNENLCSIDTKESKTDLEQSLLNENLCYIDIKESKTDMEQSPLNENRCSINIKESKLDLEPFSCDKTVPSEISVERSDNVPHNSPNKADITSIIVSSALNSDSGQSLTRMDNSTDNLLTPDSLQTVRFKLANLSGGLGVPSLNFIAATPVQSGRNSPEILGSRPENNNKTIVDVNEEPNEVLHINKNLEDTSYYILEDLDSNNMSLESIKNSNSNDLVSLSDNPDNHTFQMGNGSVISPSNLSTKENIDLDQPLDSLLPNILSSSSINEDEYGKDSSEIHDMKPKSAKEFSANVSSETYTGLGESIKETLEVAANDTLKATNGSLSFSESQLSPLSKECSSSSEKGKLETCDSSGTEDSAFDFPRSEEMSITLSHSKDAPSRESPRLNLLDTADEKSGTWRGESIGGNPSFPTEDFASATAAEEGVIAPEMKINVVEDFDMDRSELEVGEDFGLDVVKHSTPDDERSSDSGFRDKGSLSESCEDACDEKYHLEDIEAELEETFNRGGFAYVSKGIEPEDEDVTGSEPGGKEPVDVDMTDCAPDLDDTLKSLPSSFNEVHIVPSEIDNEHHQVCESNEDSLENTPVVPPEAAFVDTDQTFVKSVSKFQGHSASDHSSWKEENPSEKLFQNHNSEFLRPVLSRYTEPLAVDDVNPHLPSTGSGWFLHPPIFREDTSEIEMYQCPKEATPKGVDGTSSPCSTSSKDSKCDDSNNSENSYVSFTLDEEFVAAIRNELREKLPLAQQHSEDEEDDEDAEDELAAEADEDRADVTIHYNAYPPPLSPILEEGESSVNTTLSDQYSPFLIANFKESDSESASPLFSLDFNEQGEKNVVAMNTKKFEEEIREALANCSLSSDETESSATKDVKNASVLVEDLDPQPACVNVNGTAIVVVRGTPKPAAEDDVLMVDVETNEATLVESPTPKSHLAFVRNKKCSEDRGDVSPSTDSSDNSAGLSTSGDFDTFVIKKGRFDDSNFISSENIKDTTEIDENFTPDSISPDWGRETSVSGNVSPGRIDATPGLEVSPHKPHGNGELELESPRSLTETPASRASARTSDSDTVSEFFLTPSEKSPESGSHINTPALSDTTTDPKSHRRIYSSNRRVTTNPMFDDVEEIASRQPNNEAAEIMSALENRVLVNYQEKTSKQLPENINIFADDLLSSSESDHAEMLSLEGSSESSPVTKQGAMPSPAGGQPLLSMWPTNEDSYTDSSRYSGESSSEASPENHSGFFLSGEKHGRKKGMNIVITGSEGEVDELSPSSVRSEEPGTASPGRSTEASLREERDWSLSNQETSTKAPMPSPEEESWKKIPSMLAFSDMNDMMGRCENEEGRTAGRFDEISFTGPKDRREDNADLMSTSFSNKDDGGESYTPDWESESESTNEEDNSSSSGEFIWKEGEKEDQLSGPKVSGSPPATKVRFSLSPGFVRCGDILLWGSEQKKNVSFKKQKYHCVYEYPREVSDSEGESQHEIANRHQWESYQPPQVDYASYADWELLDEQVPDLVSSQDTDNDQDGADTPAPQHFDFYKLSNVDYDFGGEGGLLSDDGEFYISSSARPFKFSSAGTGNQFYPGEADIDDVKLDFAKESHLALLGVSVDSCDDEVNTSLLTFTPESADRPAIVSGHNDLFCVKETRSDHTIWSPSGESLPSLDGKRPVTELSPAGVLKKSLIAGGPQNSIGDISNAEGNFKNPDSICNSETSFPTSPTGLGELRHTRDRLKLDLVGSNGGFLLDPPGGGNKRRAGVRGEASLLDSGDDTEDSGIESSNGATSTRTLVMAITGEKHATSAT